MKYIRSNLFFALTYRDGDFVFSTKAKIRLVVLSMGIIR